MIAYLTVFSRARHLFWSIIFNIISSLRLISMTPCVHARSIAKAPKLLYDRSNNRCTVSFSANCYFASNQSIKDSFVFSCEGGKRLTSSNRDSYPNLYHDSFTVRKYDPLSIKKPLNGNEPLSFASAATKYTKTQSSVFPEILATPKNHGTGS
jgi:hypothetical protein